MTSPPSTPPTPCIASPALVLFFNIILPWPSGPTVPAGTPALAFVHRPYIISGMFCSLLAAVRHVLPTGPSPEQLPMWCCRPLLTTFRKASPPNLGRTCGWPSALRRSPTPFPGLSPRASGTRAPVTQSLPRRLPLPAARPSALLGGGGGGMPSSPASRWKASPQSPAQMSALLAAFPDSLGGPGAGALRGASAPP